VQTTGEENADRSSTSSDNTDQPSIVQEEVAFEEEVEQEIEAEAEVEGDSNYSLEDELSDISDITPPRRRKKKKLRHRLKSFSPKPISTAFLRQMSLPIYPSPINMENASTLFPRAPPPSPDVVHTHISEELYPELRLNCMLFNASIASLLNLVL